MARKAQSQQDSSRLNQDMMKAAIVKRQNGKWSIRPILPTVKGAKARWSRPDIGSFDERDAAEERALKMGYTVYPQCGVAIELIAKAVAQNYNIPFEKMKERGGPWGYSFARHIAIFICRKLTPCGPSVIARYFHKNHQLVYYAMKTVPNIMDTEPPVKAQVEELETTLKIKINNLMKWPVMEGVKDDG